MFSKTLFLDITANNTLQPTCTRKKVSKFFKWKAKATSKTQRLLSIHTVVNIYFDFWTSFHLITVNHQNLQKFIRRPSKLEKKIHSHPSKLPAVPDPDLEIRREGWSQKKDFFGPSGLRLI